jgi:hypothetical protein
LDYDRRGIVVDYYLSNIHKGGSGRVDGHQPLPVDELHSRYETAPNDVERRNICILAIDKGAIQTFGPVKVSTLDAIFGSHVDRIRKKGIPGKAEILLTSAAAQDAGEQPKLDSTVWRLVIDYTGDGSLSNYYLTNHTAAVK